MRWRLQRLARRKSCFQPRTRLSKKRLRRVAKKASRNFRDQVYRAGNREVLSTLHYYFQNMRYNCLLGATHWQCWSGLEINNTLPGPDPTIFFAPSEMERRVQQWGVNGLHVRFDELWSQFLMSISEWILPIHSRGKAAVEQIYLDTLAGRSKPNEGHVLSVWESEGAAVLD